MDNIIEKVNNASLKFLEPLTPQKTYQTIVQEAIKLLQAKYASLLLEENGSFKQAYSTLPINVKRRKKGTTYLAFKKLKVMATDTNSKDFKKAHPQFAQMGIQTVLDIPLSYKKQAFGVIAINLERKIELTQNELHSLLIFGSLATLAIRKTQLYDEAKKAVEIRDLFITMAAHELRTPLTTISGYIQLLHNKLSKKPGSQSKWIKELHWESRRLATLINELLEVNRIKAGLFQYNLEECSIRDILHRAVSMLKFTYSDREVLFLDTQTTEVDKIIGDYNKLLQVFNNILENASKFSFPETKVIIGLSFNTKYAIVTIQDEGKGIQKKDIPFLFEVFYKGSNTNEEEGMGVGLFLAKNIIKQHRGTIEIYSKEQKGTRVEIKLPRVTL